MNILDNLVTGHTRNIPENATIMFLRDGEQTRDGMIWLMLCARMLATIEVFTSIPMQEVVHEYY